jgi:glycosyltransferase involved in cell wall biosynthesis
MSKQATKTLSLSVIIPCYNEEANLERGVLEHVADYLGEQDYPAEVIVVDDGSTDQSLKLIKKAAKNKSLLRLVEISHQGKPRALRAGIEKARHEIVLFTDMDQSTPIEEVEKILPLFSQGFDLVIGSRGKTRENYPWYRRLLSWGFRTGRQLFILKDITDTQCGFKAARLAVARKLFANLRTIKSPKEASGWRVTAYDVELLFLAEKAGLTVTEVPVRWRDEDVASRKERNFLKESADMAVEVIRVIINDIGGRYDEI